MQAREPLAGTLFTMHNLCYMQVPTLARAPARPRPARCARRLMRLGDWAKDYMRGIRERILNDEF